MSDCHDYVVDGCDYEDVKVERDSAFRRLVETGDVLSRLAKCIRIQRRGDTSWAADEDLRLTLEQAYRVLGEKEIAR